MSEDRPLSGKTVVVTRRREQAAELVGALEGLGAGVVLAPVIRLEPRPFGDEVAAAVGALGSYDVVVFTSANAVHVFCDYLGDAAAELTRPAVAAVGPATAAALEEHGVVPNIMGTDALAEGLLEALDEQGVAGHGARVLIPRAREAREVLPGRLRDWGAVVDVLPIYDTVPADRLDVPAESVTGADYITFTSGSTVRAFAGLVGETGAGEPLAERLAGARLCSIGPATSDVLRDLGLRVAVEAAEHTAAGLAAAIAADARGRA